MTDILPHLRLNRRRILAFALGMLTAMPVFAQELKIKNSTGTIVAASGLSGSKSIVVMDAITGRVLESHNGSKALPPASVTKAATALYALSALGGDARFKTRLLATGPVQSGVLNGDLILQGSGDPHLDTDALGSLVGQLEKAGVTSVKGKFLVYAGALAHQAQIDETQPSHVGYNPTISGLNLNFNRVFFQWKRSSKGYAVDMFARAKRYSPNVQGIKMAVKNREAPVFKYRSVNGTDHWTVAQAALGKGGSRWLPVRHPADYAGEVFQSVAAINGIRVPRHKVVTRQVSGQTIAVWESGTVRTLAKSMIKYSTNMTAETLGLSASVQRGANAKSLRKSGKAMSDWLEATYGVRGARFVDHSGLGPDSRISAHEMGRFLVNAKWDGPLRSIMKEHALRNAQYKLAPIEGAKVVVKTGTLNFVSALAGYITAPNGRKLVFAILTADQKRRAQITKQNRERPAGGRTWARKSRVMQQQLIRYWIQRYGN